MPARERDAGAETMQVIEYRASRAIKERGRPIVAVHAKLTGADGMHRRERTPQPQRR
jgi:hypothetical protein